MSARCEYPVQERARTLHQAYTSYQGTWILEDYSIRTHTSLCLKHLLPFRLLTSSLPLGKPLLFSQEPSSSYLLLQVQALFEHPASQPELMDSLMQHHTCYRFRAEWSRPIGCTNLGQCLHKLLCFYLWFYGSFHGLILLMSCANVSQSL